MRAHDELFNTFARATGARIDQPIGGGEAIFNQLPYGNAVFDTDVTTLVLHDLDDDPSQLINTINCLRLASRSCKNDVVVGVNSEWRDDSDPAEFSRQSMRYHELVSTVRNQRGARDGLHLRLFLTRIPEKRTMNRVFNRYLNKIITESFVIYRPLNYPILRFDSDTMFISPDSVALAAQTIRDGGAHLLKYPTTFSYGKNTKFGSGDPGDNLTQAQQIARLYGAAKYMVEKSLGPEDERGYHDESGSGARLEDWAKHAIACKRRDPDCTSTSGENKLFLETIRAEFDDDVPPFWYLPDEIARHEASGRRAARLAKQVLAWEIPLLEEGSDYMTHSEMARMDVTELIPVRNTHADLLAMVGVVILRQEALTGPVRLTPRDISELDRFVDGCSPSNRLKQSRQFNSKDLDAYAARQQYIHAAEERLPMLAHDQSNSGILML